MQRGSSSSSSSTGVGCCSRSQSRGNRHNWNRNWSVSPTDQSTVFTAFNGGDTGLVPPPTFDLEGTEYRQGLLHGTIISRSDLDLPVLKAKQLKLRLKSNKDECQLLYCEVTYVWIELGERYWLQVC